MKRTRTILTALASLKPTNNPLSMIRADLGALAIAASISILAHSFSVTPDAPATINKTSFEKRTSASPDALRPLAQQSGARLVHSADAVSGVKMNAVQGEVTHPGGGAVDRM